ncbi:hypothetical protein [Natrinema pallidum]|uniref:hypothetical protein n=1 Tax=Natrinema pallidum TaxID=69527 RepID=UPI001268B44A|nr:hypothetical protein [Natrinema pallidum]
MSESPEVDRQFREKQTYNLFFSAMTARASPCLADLGWRMPVKFGEINDTYSGVDSEPDFVLYDGDTCLLVEIKSGNNIEDRHIRQMQRCNELTIDGVEEELENANVREKTPYDGSVQTIDRCIVYHDIDEDWIGQCRNEWQSCQKQLERLEEEAAVLTQDFGGKLRRVAGEFKSGRLQNRFNRGIELPENPKEEFVLTEQMEKEILAVAVCGIWGEQSMGYENPVQVSVNQVRDHFAPVFNVPPDRVNRVLYYLQKVGACNHVEGLTYEFSHNHISEVLQITQTVRENRVDDVLEDINHNLPDEQQTTWDMISEEGIADGSGDKSVDEDGRNQEGSNSNDSNAE